MAAMDSKMKAMQDGMMMMGMMGGGMADMPGKKPMPGTMVQRQQMMDQMPTPAAN